MLIDSHAHLNFPELSETEVVLARAKDAGVETIINIGTSLEDSRTGIGIAQKFSNVYTAVGIHPNDSIDNTVDTVDWNEFEELAKSPKVVAIGECGLDYSSIKDPLLSTEYSKETERQKKLFLKQIEIANKLGLPLSIHVRDAYEDMLEIALKIKTAAVFHCMSGAPDYLISLVHLSPNFYFSFAGNVTFKNAHNIRELAKLVPLDRLLVETDSPFLTPEPHRGSRNEPANVKIVAEKLAEVKNISLDELAKVTSENCRRLFNLKS